jgi:hypothetical protein
MTSNYMDREISDEYISDFLEGLDPQKRKCPFPVSLKIPREFFKRTVRTWSFDSRRFAEKYFTARRRDVEEKESLKRNRRESDDDESDDEDCVESAATGSNSNSQRKFLRENPQCKFELLHMNGRKSDFIEDKVISKVNINK